MNLLISIHPDHARAIQEGRKRAELRRQLPTLLPGAWIYVYSTKPIGAVLFRVQYQCKAEHGNAAGLLRILARMDADPCVTESEAYSYFDGSDLCGALILGTVETLPNPVPLSELRRVGIKPPQSWRYLGPDTTAAIDVAGECSTSNHTTKENKK